MKLYFQKYGMLPKCSGGLNFPLDLRYLRLSCDLLPSTPISPFSIFSSSVLFRSNVRGGVFSGVLSFLSTSTWTCLPSDLLLQSDLAVLSISVNLSHFCLGLRNDTLPLLSFYLRDTHIFPAQSSQLAFVRRLLNFNRC